MVQGIARQRAWEATLRNDEVQLQCAMLGDSGCMTSEFEVFLRC